MVEELKAAIEAVRDADAKKASSEAYDLAYSRAFDLLRDQGQALVEALADAERYRYVRRKEAWREVQENPHHGSISAIYVGRGDHGSADAMDTEELDKAIDTARGKP